MKKEISPPETYPASSGPGEILRANKRRETSAMIFAGKSRGERTCSALTQVHFIVPSHAHTDMFPRHNPAISTIYFKLTFMCSLHCVDSD